jgi:UDP-N-acetylmuramoylalanine--D-glutamate ligase
MKVLVIGYGVSGKSAAAFLKAQGHDCVIVDKKAGPGVLLDSGDLSLEGISQVILSPGVSQEHPLVQKALKKGLEVIGEIELGMRFVKNRCFGITGANGKTTTVLLIAHVLNSADKKARALGNVGDSLTSYLCAADPEEILILELSSFQLETMQTAALEMALVLNITPNHLDRYESMSGYVQAKARIQGCIKRGGECFISTQVEEAFGAQFVGAKNFEKEVDLNFGISYTDLKMAHKQSVQAAYLVCKRCGVSDMEFLRALQSFQKPPHRIECVAEIHGVRYYNDSKSSNIHSVMHALSCFSGPLVLIVGGVHKGASYLPWLEHFKGRVREVVAYGQAAPLMEKELAGSVAFKRVDRFADAVNYAKNNAKNNETVLLSPGCSSYDQFQNYEQRGEEFKRLVREK